VTFAEALVRSRGGAMPPHAHAEASQIELISGTGACTLGDQRITVADGVLLHIPAGLPHSFESASSGSTRHLTAKFRPSNPVVHALPALSLHLQNRGLLHRFQDQMRTIVEEWQLHRWGYPESISLRLAAIVLEALRLWREPHPEGVPAGVIEDACRYMALHHGQPLSTRHVAEHCGLRPDSLCRLFRRHLRMTPGQYLLQARLRHAQALLRSGYLVKECAYRSGFSSIHYFSRAFHLHLGMSPSEWAQRGAP
jgi:AraC-like DNA-binding protein